MENNKALADAVARAEAYAPFLRRTLSRNPTVPDRLAEVGLAATLAEARAASLTETDARAALRRERQVVALAVALADLAGIELDAVVAALTEFADYAVDRALAAIFAERTPDAPITGFVALALGKQGSRELNYSSDIDPILLFDPQTLPRRPREDPVEAAVRIARSLVGFLQEPTGDGTVLRVDLRLRPASEASPLAVPIGAAIAHYESSALPWERAAFIKARPMAGDLALGAAFLAHIRPFVWRRSLDFGTLRDVRGLSRRIRQHHAQGQVLGAGYDLKRGRGGIREIEFFAQIHQLIHGGRDPALRVPATQDALRALAGAGWIGAAQAEMLAEAYVLLRTIEHRLQMIEDQQTHRLPLDPAALDAVGRLSGFSDGSALIDRLRPEVDRVGLLYDGLDPPEIEDLPVAGEGLATFLGEAGFQEAAGGAARIERWRNGAVRTTRSNAAREALEAVLPPLIAALGKSPSPDTALARFDDLVSRIPTAINLFRLLEARPQLLDLLAAILANAPSLAADLVRRASLLDGLIDASALAPPPAIPQIAAALRGTAGDYQDLLETVRLGVGERRFALGAQVIGGARDPIEVGRGYARIAEAALDVLASATVAEFEGAHGRVPGSELIILALGRFGGGVMTHASDLDIVYLFTGDFLSESDGRRPLGATSYFNRLCQRVSAAMSVPTASGSLYEIDTRLRPSGAQGMLAVSLDSFARYEEENAWTWEHMALTRARPVFGSADAWAAAQSVIDAALARPRDLAALTADAAKMRAEIARHKPPAGAYDVKLIAGGLIDAEFAIHLLQLSAHVGVRPDLLAAAAELEGAGLLAKGFGKALTLLQCMLITLRLIAPDGGLPLEPSLALMVQACGHREWDQLDAAYAAARALVSGEWRRIAGLA